MIGEGASTAQRSDSLVQSINQRFLNLEVMIMPINRRQFLSMAGATNWRLWVLINLHLTMLAILTITAIFLLTVILLRRN